MNQQKKTVGVGECFMSPLLADGRPLFLDGGGIHVCGNAEYRDSAKAF